MASSATMMGAALRQVERLFEASSGTVAGLDDRALWERFALDRDEAAFEALVVRHGPMVLATARAILGDHHAAEDVFQTTFVALARRGDSIRDLNTLAPWLHRVAARASVRLRRRTRRQTAREHAVEARPYTVGPSHRDEVRAAVHAELDRLPAAYRLPIVLCDLEGWTRASAAAHLGWTEGAVRGRLERGRARLRVRLTRQGFGPALGAASSILACGGDAGAAVLASRGLIPPLAPGLVAQAVRSGVAASLLATGPLAWAGQVGSMALGPLSVRGPLVALGLVGAVGLVGSGGWLRSDRPQPSGPTALTSSRGDDGIGPIGQPPASPGRATPPPDPVPSMAVTVNVAGPEKPADLVEVRGVVVDPAANPVPGATVRVRPHVGMSPRPAETVVQADASGRFAVKIPRRLLDSKPYVSGVLVASSPGFGLGWLAIGKQPFPDPGNVVLTLSADAHPIEGRVVDPANQPIPGALVQVAAVYAPTTPDLTRWAAQVRERGSRGAWEGQNSGELIHLGPFPDLAARTDADGRYRLVGLGAERVAELIVSAPGRATTEVFATTQSRGAIQSADRGIAFFGVTYRPSRSGTILPPGRVVFGTVRDADSGAPIAGLPLEGQFFEAGWNSLPLPGVATTTNPRGEYRLEGFPVGNRRYRISVRPRPDQPYLRSDQATLGAPELHTFMEISKWRRDPIQADLSLRRGVVIHGRVTDARTKEPLVNAVVATYALKGNEELARYPGVTKDAVAFTRTDTNGQYEVAALPGRGLLTVSAPGGIGGRPKEYLGVDGYNPATRDFDTLVGHVSNLAYVDSAVAIRFEEGTTPTLGIEIDRGRKVAGTIVDPDGRPLTGTSSYLVESSFRRLDPNPTDRFEAIGLDPKTPRRVFFYHEDRKLVGSVVLRGDETEPVVVRLVPWGSIKGRLVAQDGKPLAGWSVIGNVGETRHDLDRGATIDQEVVTDADGRFRLDGMVAGLIYDVHPSRDNSLGAPIRQGLIIAPGELKDLGNVCPRPYDDK